MVAKLTIVLVVVILAPAGVAAAQADPLVDQYGELPPAVDEPGTEPGTGTASEDTGDGDTPAPLSDTSEDPGSLASSGEAVEEPSEPAEPDAPGDQPQGDGDRKGERDDDRDDAVGAGGTGGGDGGTSATGGPVEAILAIESGSGVGLILPIMIAISLITALVYGISRRRTPGSPVATR